MSKRFVRVIAGIFALSAALSACSPSQGDAGSPMPPDAAGQPTAPANATDPVAPSPGSGDVVLVTTNSFAISDATKAAFEQQSGLTLTVLPVGSAGILANQLVLTRDHPLGDAYFGVDNTFISRLLDNQVISAEPDELGMAPITQGDVCLNIDTAWFTEHQVAPPTGLSSLLAPEYQGLTIVLNPATSSPGLAFLLATVAAFGDDSLGIVGHSDDARYAQNWQDFWTQLRANGATVSDSWSDAYFSSFSGAGEGGQLPIVVSYSSSPASTLTADGSATTTAALLNTCFRQTEYAGVLYNANNPAGARALIEFLQSRAFQQDLPEQMWVFPIDPSVQLPADWAQFAPQATDPLELYPADIEANREQWIEEWTQLMFG